ncbi:MAG: N-6 DNA methylase [Candidatus Atabeyarchaeum deiterrae]
MAERDIHVELYRILKNFIDEEKFSSMGIEFTGVKYEPTVNGRPDLVLEVIEKGKRLPLLVIETKRKVPFIDRRFDPYSKDVVKQASGYAVTMGSPYFATCNGDVLVLFDTFTAGVPLPERRLKQFKVSFDRDFAKVLLEELCRFRVGKGKWLELNDVFVLRLRTFHTFVSSFILDSLKEQLKLDLGFKDRYVSWLRSQFFEFSSDTNEKIAEQFAYMLMNRLTFYKTLETQIPDLPKLRKIETEDPKAFSDKLRETLVKTCKSFDYEAVLKPHDVLDQIPLPRKLVYAFNDLIEELETYDLSKIESDVIGRVYEELIPDEERHRLGQYYTPPPIVELITEMCIRSPRDRVLDPACGSGGFLVKAYHKLKELKKRDNPIADDATLHREILDEVYGVDINPFPGQLSAINLAVRNLKVRTKVINVTISDFFSSNLTGGYIPKDFDAVVANPPYTRQEEMDRKKEIREIALICSDGSKIDMDSRAGIFAYFFTHGANFLRNHGMMGQITSDTWLDVGFGEDLKRFFLDHFKIDSVIWYDIRAFEKALVGTCVTTLQKEESKKNREDNVVRFVRIKKSMPTGAIVEKIQTSEKDFEDDRIGVTLRRQRELRPEDKWGIILRAPTIYYRILGSEKVAKLGEIASVKRGITSGANEFFYLDRGKVKLWSIERKYLKPIVVSPKEKKIQVRPEDITEWALMVNKSKDELSQEGANVLKYIRWGEEQEPAIKGGKRDGSTVKGYHKLTTVSYHDPWFYIGEREPAPILRSRRIWERCIYLLNEANALANDSLFEIRPNDEGDVTVLAGILNSSITALASELEGRFYGGGILELEVYETKAMTVVDPGRLSSGERRRIEAAFSKVCEAQNKGNEKIEREARLLLDSVVFDVLGLKDNERTQVYEGIELLRTMRMARKDVGVLVETAEKWEPWKPMKLKRTEDKPSKRLDEWMRREDS